MEMDNHTTFGKKIDSGHSQNSLLLELCLALQPLPKALRVIWSTKHEDDKQVTKQYIIYIPLY